MQIPLLSFVVQTEEQEKMAGKPPFAPHPYLSKQPLSAHKCKIPACHRQHTCLVDALFPQQ